MTAVAGTSTSGIASREPVLSPVDRVQGVIFGLIMALTFTGSLSVATADRAEVREMLIGALGCNIAWGLVDAVMYLMAVVAERGREFILLRELHTTRDAASARKLILAPLPQLVAEAMDPAEIDRVDARLAGLPDLERARGLDLRDLRAAFGGFPAGVPLDPAHRAAVRVHRGRPPRPPGIQRDRAGDAVPGWVPAGPLFRT